MQTVKDLRLQAKTYRELAQEYEEKAFNKQEDLLKDLQRKKNDPLIRKKDALKLLWFGSYQGLSDWIDKVEGLGYLRFENSKILRSEVLRFRDDYYNGKIHRQLRLQAANVE